MSRIVRTACNRDCPDACVLEVHLDAHGRALKLTGADADPVTRGFLCERTSRFLYRQYAPNRLLTPMVRPRKGAPLEAASWDQALDLCARKLLQIRSESGPAAILNYRSGGSLGLLKTLADYLFEQFGPVTIKRGDICSGAGEAAQELDFGRCESNDLFDLFNSRVILIWGKNVHVSSPHLLPILLEARRRGARLIGVDPVRTRLAGICETFLQPRAGCDFALAMGVARRLFDQGWIDPGAARICANLDQFRDLTRQHTATEWDALCGLDSSAVDDLAEAYGQTRPGAILVGWGLARRANGAATVRALDALGAITGNLGVPGGGVSYYFGRRTSFDTSFVKGAEVAPRTLAEARLGPEILEAQDPPIRAVWVTAGNPVAMLPESDTVARALGQTEFVVVVDTHPTDTTDLADVVLPTLTLLEDEDLLGSYGHHLVRASKPALSPPGEARHELWIWQRLAERLGVQGLEGSLEEWKTRIARPLLERGITLEQMAQESVRNPYAAEVLFSDGNFPTDSGKVQLVAEAPAFPSGDAEYPLTLMALSNPRSQSSQWSVDTEAVPPARVHPDSVNGFGNGQRVYLESRVARLEVLLQVDPSVRPGVVVMAKGGSVRDGQCPNLLVEARETDLGGGACYYDQGVRLAT